MTDKGRKLFNYDHPGACAACPLKARCTQAAYRTVSRWEHELSLERMAAAVAAAPEKLKRRKTLIEHCWGTLKWLLPGGFLVRGKVKVGAEVNLAHFGYNLKRALAVVGLEKLLAALADFAAEGGGAGARPSRAPRAVSALILLWHLLRTTGTRWLQLLLVRAGLAVP